MSVGHWSTGQITIEKLRLLANGRLFRTGSQRFASKFNSHALTFQGSRTVDLWSGTANAVNGAPPHFALSIPAGLLTSQGLV